MKCKVSVIIPVYNMENHLEQCLDSVLTQTLVDMEVVCVNDGSKDSSLQILKSFAKRDSRIFIINQDNKGVAESRNIGIQKAEGTYISFMDPDDWYPDCDVLETLYNNALQNNTLICGGEFSDYDENTGTINTKFADEYFGYVFEREGVIDYSTYQFDFGYQRFLFLRNFLIEYDIFFPNLCRYQDPPFFVKAMLQAKTFYAVKTVVYVYRYGHRGNIWTSQKVEDLVKGMSIVLDFAIENDLQKLIDITLFRMKNEYEEIVFDELKQGNIRLACEIQDFYAKRYKHGNPNLENLYLEKVVREVAEMHVNEHKMQKEIQEQKCEIELLKKSKTFRIGKMIIYIPQKLYWWLKNI